MRPSGRRRHLQLLRAEPGTLAFAPGTVPADECNQRRCARADLRGAGRRGSLSDSASVELPDRGASARRNAQVRSIPALVMKASARSAIRPPRLCAWIHAKAQLSGDVGAHLECPNGREAIAIPALLSSHRSDADTSVAAWRSAPSSSPSNASTLRGLGAAQAIPWFSLCRARTSTWCGV